MPEPGRDDPIEPLPDEVDALRAQLAAVLANAEALQSANETLRAQLAEHAERDAPNWQPLKRAAGNVPMPYENARAWAERAIAAGRLHEARKPRGRVEVNLTALRAHHMTSK